MDAKNIAGEAENRLQTIRKYLFLKGITMSELSRRCQHKISRGGVAYRVRVGDCMMADMVDMAEAAGYKFVWHWEDVHPVEPSLGQSACPTSCTASCFAPFWGICLKRISAFRIWPEGVAFPAVVWHSAFGRACA